jgi:sterol desaturase/sphingolipid hydroxylase (fatty acid hydroxylase superfamily)
MEHYGRSPIFALVVIACVGAEALWRTLFSRRGYDGGAAAASLGVAVGNAICGGLSALALAGIYGWVWSLAQVRWPLSDWRTWVAAFVLVEFVYYWFHRWSHTVRWLWATHAVHHSAEEMTLPAAIRLGWTNILSGGWVLFLPLIAAGFHPLLVLGLLTVDLRYQFFLHTEAVGKLGPLEWVLNTPSHHRVHHASNGDYLDKNFGGMVIVFDRLFGTFAEERPDTEPLRYGLVHPVGSKNPFRIVFHEWGRMSADLVAARNLPQAWRAAFGRPG